MFAHFFLAWLHNDFLSSKMFSYKTSHTLFYDYTPNMIFMNLFTTYNVLFLCSSLCFFPYSLYRFLIIICHALSLSMYFIWPHGKRNCALNFAWKKTLWYTLTELAVYLFIFFFVYLLFIIFAYYSLFLLLWQQYEEKNNNMDIIYFYYYDIDIFGCSLELLPFYFFLLLLFYIFLHTHRIFICCIFSFFLC